MNSPLILIIDDEPQIRKLLTINLESNDYRHIEAENGETGIKLAASHNPDLVLLDLGLPDLDGVQGLKRIREWSLVPIIILSVRDQED